VTALGALTGMKTGFEQVIFPGAVNLPEISSYAETFDLGSCGRIANPLQDNVLPHKGLSTRASS
jgi:hypothetical protein